VRTVVNAADGAGATGLRPRSPTASLNRVPRPGGRLYLDFSTSLRSAVPRRFDSGATARLLAPARSLRTFGTVARDGHGRRIAALTPGGTCAWTGL
jgi:hypothetical protein